MSAITVLGEGAWGTAIAVLLADNGHDVALWCYDHHVASDIAQTGYNNRYLPGIRLSTRITPTIDMEQALHPAEWVFEAIPVTHLRSVLTSARPWATPNQVWIVLSKGIENKSGLLPTQLIVELFGFEGAKAVIAGPSFAHEVAARQMTTVVVAATTASIAQDLCALVTNEYFKACISSDIVGVQVCAAFKNIIALGIGLLQGAGYGENSKAFFITRGLQEMAALSSALAGQVETVYGLAGVGDLILTACGMSSKNLMLGRALGSGNSLDDALRTFGSVPEGFNTLKTVMHMMQVHNLSLPVSQQIHAVLFSGRSVHEMVCALI